MKTDKIENSAGYKKYYYKVSTSLLFQRFQRLISYAVIIRDFQTLFNLLPRILDFCLVSKNCKKWLCGHDYKQKMSRYAHKLKESQSSS